MGAIDEKRALWRQRKAAQRAFERAIRDLKRRQRERVEPPAPAQNRYRPDGRWRGRVASRFAWLRARLVTLCQRLGLPELRLLSLQSLGCVVVNGVAHQTPPRAMTPVETRIVQAAAELERAEFWFSLRHDRDEAATALCRVMHAIQSLEVYYGKIEDAKAAPVSGAGHAGPAS